MSLTPKEPFEEVVPRAYVVSVPQAKPSTVALAPPVEVMLLEAVAPVVVMEDIVGVRMVGMTGATAEVVNV